jgi:kumamolisin
MKASKLVKRTLAIGIATIPVLGMSATDINASTPQTPNVQASANTSPQAVLPYIAPLGVFVPESTKAVAGQEGVYAHTHYTVQNPKGVTPASLTDLSQPEPAANPTPGLTTAEYPASLACIYKVGPAYAGCVPTINSAYNATGGSRAIAIVIAFDNPTVVADLQYFSSVFALSVPTPTVVKVTKSVNSAASCSSVPANSGWALESALDTQWAHAMAPSAKIILVEACDNSYDQLMLAEQIATQQVNLYGGGQVSNSWGGGEWAGETGYDYVFRSNWAYNKPVNYIFSAGDSGLGAEYPSSSPWVISAGGTTINRDGSYNFVSESCWAGSGGGTSAYETYSSNFGSGTGPWTNYQYPLFGQASRRTPDISFNADPASGVWVRFNGSWYIVGGTSVSAPALAGIINNSNNRLGIAPAPGGYYTNAENNLLYAQLLTYKEYKTNFYDVTTGSNGASAGTGWDYCTGVGSPRGKLGK